MNRLLDSCGERKTSALRAFLATEFHAIIVAAEYSSANLALMRVEAFGSHLHRDTCNLALFVLVKYL